MQTSNGMACPVRCSFKIRMDKALSKLPSSNGSSCKELEVGPNTRPSSDLSQLEWMNLKVLFVTLGLEVEWNTYLGSSWQFLDQSRLCVSLSLWCIIVMPYPNSVFSVYKLLHGTAEACICRFYAGICCDHCLSIREFTDVSCFPRQGDVLNWRAENPHRNWWACVPSNQWHSSQ